MKKTQIATLKFLASGSKSFYDIYWELRRIFPDMKTGINFFNVDVMLSYLRKNGYIALDNLLTPAVYDLSLKGAEYVNKLKQWGVNHDK